MLVPPNSFHGRYTSERNGPPHPERVPDPLLWFAPEMSCGACATRCWERRADSTSFEREGDTALTHMACQAQTTRYCVFSLGQQQYPQHIVACGRLWKNKQINDLDPLS